MSRFTLFKHRNATVQQVLKWLSYSLLTMLCIYNSVNTFKCTKNAEAWKACHFDCPTESSSQNDSDSKEDGERTVISLCSFRFKEI